VKPNEYLILSECVEDGINLGYTRAHKHTDTPTEQQIKEAIEQAVMTEICQYFLFEDLNNANNT
jgi:hypothetical protein